MYGASGAAGGSCQMLLRPSPNSAANAGAASSVSIPMAMHIPVCFRALCRSVTSWRMESARSSRGPGYGPSVTTCSWEIKDSWEIKEGRHGEWVLQTGNCLDDP